MMRVGVFALFFLTACSGGPNGSNGGGTSSGGGAGGGGSSTGGGGAAGGGSSTGGGGGGSATGGGGAVGGGAAAGGGSAGGGSGGGSSGGSGGGEVDAGPPDAGLPCEIAEILQTYCQRCHGSLLINNAPFPLLTRDDLLKPSGISHDVDATRALLRMQSALGPMPPLPAQPVSPDAIAVFAAWLDAGLPGGGFECDGGLDLGDGGVVDIDAGPIVCASGQRWDSQQNPDDIDMYPGRACITCHTALDVIYDQFGWAGTVMASSAESDQCIAPPPADGGVVEIDLPDGGALLLYVNATGNFETKTTLAAPYFARVRAHGLAVSSQTPHLSGDCNACHSPQGDPDAGGRLVFP
jgi:hypothetical protein